MFIVIIRTEAPVARNKYPEETVEKILGAVECELGFRIREI